MRVTPLQLNLIWHQPAANRAHIASCIKDLAHKTDLIVLPEMFTSGFTQFPEDINQQDSTIEWMQTQAAASGAAIVGSLAFEKALAGVAEQAPFVNRMVFVEPNGDVHTYDKVHLFRMAGEHKRYQAGTGRKVIAYRDWRILLTVCYDLRFPVFCRNQNDYDMMLCVANWPAARRMHWRSLLQARAIENHAYVIGVNRVGIDGNGLEYSGDSMVLDMKGEYLFDGAGGKESHSTVLLDKQTLCDYRESFPVWQDADPFTLLT